MYLNNSLKSNTQPEEWQQSAKHEMKVHVLTASSRMKNRILDNKSLPLWMKSSNLPGVHVIMSMPDMIILSCSFTEILPMTSAFLKMKINILICNEQKIVMHSF